MSWHTNPAMMAIRKVARRTGLTRVAGRILQRSGYETAFDDALFAEIQPGDIVWDVGANVGYYTGKFAEACGSRGRVIAFEPFPATVARLQETVGGIETVTVVPMALGAESAMTMMQAGDDPLGATSRIVAAGVNGQQVETETGDSIIERGLAPPPNIAKIDTEGFELDVLKGMPTLLANPGFRAVFIEVHFGLLADRGLPRAPAEIEQRLRASGFAVQWVDSSHIIGKRH